MGMSILRWFAITAALGFACSLVQTRPDYYQARQRRDLRVRNPSEKGINDREGSCAQSEIQHNVTLKGGIRAGYFRKLAQYVAMRLCVELCCEEKGCDVAFMSGRNCYGVQCFSEEQCQSIPAKQLPSDPIFISHVTFKGEGTHKTNEPKNLQCSATRMKVGVTLRGGLKSGNFTDVGKVDNMVICTRLCCVAEKCDLAMMINQSCFLVSCYNMQLCQVIKAISTRYQPSVAYVMRRTRELQNDTATKLQVLHTSDSKLMCKKSQIFYNSTLRGGYKAGNFTDLGKVVNMSACVRLCCGDKNCDAAFMLERNCYAVTCIKADLCTPVHAKKSGALISLNPKISYITSRSEEVMSKKIKSADGLCHAGVISYDVTLRGGMAAGNFTPHGKVGSMESCIEKCCRQKACNAAMMLKDACFTVQCFKDEFCEKKPIPTSSSYNPKIAYVFRDRKPNVKASKKPLAVLLQHLNLLSKPTTNLSSTKHHSKGTSSKITENIHSTHKPIPTPTKHRTVNSTERLSRLLNETSYTKGEIKETSSKNILDTTSSNASSIPDLVRSAVPDGLMSNRSSLSDRLISNQFNKSTTVESDDNSVLLELPTENSITRINNTRNSIMMSKKLDNASNVLQPTKSTALSKPTQKDFATELILSLITDDSRNINSSISIPLPDPLFIPDLGSGSRPVPDSYPFTFSDSALDGLEKPLVHDGFEAAKDKVISSNSEGTISPGQRLIGEDPGCTNSEVIRNMTLRGGIDAGKFKDRGIMDDFRQCIKICCIAKRCDLAFMLKNNCFSVECISEELCEAIPTRRKSEDTPILSYIYARSSPLTKRQAERPETSWKSNERNYPLFHIVRRTVEFLKVNNPKIMRKKRSQDWSPRRTLPKLRLKIPNR